jgi:hypothetical protein
VTAARTVCVTVGVAALLATWECIILNSPECIIGAQRPEERTLRCHHPTAAGLGLRCSINRHEDTAYISFCLMTSSFMRSGFRREGSYLGSRKCLQLPAEGVFFLVFASVAA